MSRKNKTLLAIAGVGAIGLKAAQGFANDLSYLFRDFSRLSVGAYSSGEGLRFASSLSGGVFLGELGNKAEEIMRVPKSLRGAFPALAATLGAGVIANYCGNVFGFEQGRGIVESTGKIMQSYGDALYNLSTFNPKTSSIGLVGATTALHSTARFAKNLLVGLVRYADKVEEKRKMKEMERGAESA